MKAALGALTLAVCLLFSAGSLEAQEAVKLNGAWSCDDGGTYYVTEFAGHLFWYGESADGGRSWSNIFHAELSKTGSKDGVARVGTTLGGAWTDVPKGAARNNGILFILIDGKDSFHITKQGLGRSNFSGKTFTRK